MICANNFIKYTRDNNNKLRTKIEQLHTINSIGVRQVEEERVMRAKEVDRLTYEFLLVAPILRTHSESISTLSALRFEQ